MDSFNWLNKNKKLPTLEQLALQVFFDELVYKATPQSVQSVRDLIDQHLWGRVKKTVREKCVAHLSTIFDFKFSTLWRDVFTPGAVQQLHNTYKNYSNSEGEKDMLHEYAPLDCVLDEYFTELAVYTPAPHLDSFPKLMSAIARRSPKLKELAIRFHHCPYKLVNMESPTTPSSSITAMPSWQNLRFALLTHLDLEQFSDLDIVTREHEDPLNSDPTHKSILSFIGKHCPVLISLIVSLDFCLQKKHLLGLLVNGDVNEKLFPAEDERWSQDSVLEGLQIPTELLNPLCSTLQELTLHLNCYRNCSSLPTFSVYAFTLRHLPKLRAIRVSEEIDTEVFQIIHKVKEMGISPHQKGFEEACRDVAVALNIGSGKDSITLPTPFTDFPFMERLNFPIPLSDADSVRAIGSLFPQMKKATFEFFNSSFDSEEEKFSEKLVSLLSGWSSEIRDLKLIRVNPKFVKPVLDKFGPNLTKLRFESCKEIDFDLLASCSKLQKLCIDGSSSTIKSEISDAARHWTSDTLLPALTTFRCRVCLGGWSPLIIERKSTKLISVILECCHIGLEAHIPRLDWTEIPELWPDLEYCSIERCSSLTTTIVSEILPQLKKLRVIELPHSVLSQNPELIEKMMQELSNRKEPVKIINRQMRDHFFVCPFQQP